MPFSLNFTAYDASMLLQLSICHFLWLYDAYDVKLAIFYLCKCLLAVLFLSELPLSTTTWLMGFEIWRFCMRWFYKRREVVYYFSAYYYGQSSGWILFPTNSRWHILFPACLNSHRSRTWRATVLPPGVRPSYGSEVRENQKMERPWEGDKTHWLHVAGPLLQEEMIAQGVGVVDLSNTSVNFCLICLCNLTLDSCCMVHKQWRTSNNVICLCCVIFVYICLSSFIYVFVCENII